MSNVGRLLSNDKLWFSYKYTTLYDETLIMRSNQYFNVNFNPITLNRIANHMMYDNYGNLITNNTMKFNRTIMSMEICKR